jgi:hypothetical protein
MFTTSRAQQEQEQQNENEFIPTSAGAGYGGYCYLPSSFDADIHKPVYTVGVLAIRGFEDAIAEFNKTFAEYLTATAGQRFDTPIRFEMRPMDFLSLFTDTASSLVDFIYVNPSAFSCIESEYEAKSLVSQISARKVGEMQYNLREFGGVIMTRSDRDDINTIADIQDKIVAAASISGLGSGQMQFLEMINAGMSYINDPKQIVFTSDQGLVVNGILSGEFDVGFVRTDQIERSVDGDGNPIDPSLFKVIDPKRNISTDGKPFPFQTSTGLYPEWNVAALSHVPEDVSYELQNALLALSDHARIGMAVENCSQTFGNETDYCDTLPFPQAFGEARCDTSKEIASLALEAGRTGKYAGWSTTLSYMSLRSMQESTGFIVMDEQSKTWRCMRSAELYDSITCPAGYLLKTREEVNSGCAEKDLVCKDGYQCFCRPCYKPLDCIDSVDVFGRCVEYYVFLPSILVPIAFIFFAACAGILSCKSRQLVIQAKKAAKNERDLNEFIA